MAGPAVIVATVLVMLRDFAFRGLLTRIDVLQVWLPTYCFMGKRLAAGHIPAWNPHLMGGLPFAADPQSGWLYVPVMMLFSALRCDQAIRWMIVLQPLLAGLGLYAFLRSERLGRAAATAGGVVLALGIAGAQFAVSLPFAGSMAWSAVLLAACSRYLASSSWPSRLLWCLLAALAWGQLAAAHFSVGLLLGSATLVAYFGATVWVAWRRDGRLRGRDALILAGLLAAALLAVNAGYLWPRLAYLRETNLSLGYARLQRLGAQLAGKAPPTSTMGFATDPKWPLKFSTTSGVHLGAIPLGLAFAGWWSRRLRPLVVAFSVLGALCYVLSLRWTALRTPVRFRSLRLVDLYLHNPQWFGLALALIIAVLAAVGLRAWLEARSLRRRLVMLVPGVVVWGVLPPLFGAPFGQLTLIGIGAAVGAVALVLAARRPALAALVPAVLAVELVANGASRPLHQPFGAIPVVSGPKGPRRTPPGLALLLPDEALLFRIDNVGAYLPVQLLRFWEFDRAVTGRNLRYDLASFASMPPVAMDQLQVGYVLAPAGRGPPGAEPVAEQDSWDLYAVTDPAPRASVLSSWSVMESPEQALRAVSDPSFDPSSRVVLERDPGVRPSAQGTTGATATYRQLGPQAATISVDTPGPAMILVRNAFDPHWHATLDRRTVPLLRADSFMQAVAVPAGRHIIHLSYDDARIGQGLAGSAVAIACLVGTAVILRRRSRRKRGTPPSEPAPGIMRLPDG